ncbi:DUF1835 domain-containing protein [Niallia sp. 03133]|uniref:DUF1835 domain-containing protein n=1 Tax=Niallia sp. 03133 TaxID=3458060 RepID=UPI004044E6B3
MIHIVNGDIVGEKIKNLVGEVLVWREMYDVGPLSRDDSKEEWIKRRARFFEEKMEIPYSLFMDNCTAQNQFLFDLPRTEEITLWFEHDRYDQTMLLYLLEELSVLGFQKMSMVSINKYPGIEPFFGLGQLSSSQLEQLYENSKQSISLEQINEAKSAWKAYTSSNLNDLENWIDSSQDKLPFLKQAMVAHTSYFSSRNDRLNEVDLLILAFLKVKQCTFAELFNYISSQRIKDGLSDLHVAFILNGLIKRDHPLLQSDHPLPSYKNSTPHSAIWITSYGLEVLMEINEN